MTVNEKAEIHHYIKNVLQGLISYLNTGLTHRAELKKSDLKSLSNHIYVLASIQDLVFAPQNKSLKDPIPLERVIAKLLEINEIDVDVDSLPQMLIGAKRAANIGIILNELIHFLKERGKSPISAVVNYDDPAPASLVFSVQSGFPSEKIKKEAGDELKLAEMLTKAELKVTLPIEVSDDEIKVALPLAL